MVWHAEEMNQTAKSSSSRQQLISAAGRVLRERGLHGVRVREVAAAAGMAVGSVMYHYGSTEDLLLAVHTDVQSRYLELRRAAIESASSNAWDKLLDMFKVGLPPFTDGELIELLYEMHGLTRRSPRHAVLLTELWETEFELSLTVVDEGIEEGIFDVDDRKSAARSLLALEDGLALHLVSENAALSSALALQTYTAAAASILGYSATTGS